MKLFALSMICVSMSMSAACTTKDDSDSSVAASDAAPAETTLQEPVQQQANTEPEESGADLSSLDDLLPDEFSVLTAPYLGDLDGMAERRVLRVLVVAEGPLFFYYNGKPRGIVAEMLVQLQDQINKDLGRSLDQVELVPMPVSRDRLIPSLLDGQADLVAADLTVTDARAALVDFSDPLARHVDEVVVFAPGYGDDVQSLDDLSGHEIYVRESSSYYEHLLALNEQFASRGVAPVEITRANELLRTEDILEMLNAELISATVVDEYKARLWSQIFTELHVRDDIVIHADGEIAWLIRKDSPQIEAAINKFMQTHRVGTLMGNVLIKRYLENLQWIRNSTSQASIEKLRPLLELFRASAEENKLDTLMLVAQAYQESELDNDRKSQAGAVGIMQIKPSTAADKNVGVDDISSPANNIRAGARYMRFLMNRYFSDPGMDELHQWLFALAAYNAGPAAVSRLREQAVAEGHDPNLWIENVELVAARQIGRETVHYVRNVFKYYVAYKMSWENRAMRQSIESVARNNIAEMAAITSER